MDTPTELHIHMLGEFSLSYGGETILDQNSRSHKIWTFLEYLITFREKEIPQNDIIELLWPDDDTITDPSNTLKTLLHRVRSQLAQLDSEHLRNAVTYRRGAYRWAPQVPCRVDVEDFEALCKEASQEQDPQQRLDLLNQAVALYKGDFLPRSALEPWAIPINTYYRTQYVAAVHDALALMTQAGLVEQALALSQKAVTIDPYDERLHLSVIQNLLATGARRAALQHYKHVTDLFFEQFGVSPSEALTALYKEVVKTDKNLELDLHVIKEGLQEQAPEKGAFFCEYSFFKDIYQLEARSAIRTGEVIHIALLSVSSRTPKELSQRQTKLAMDQLKGVISTSLRRNDVFCRYSVTQYLLMLPSANFENGQMILNRIVSAFRNKHPLTPIAMHYKVLPLDPLQS